MIEEYLSDEEYEDYFPKLDNLRKKIAYALPVEQNMSILDLATGYGYFAIEIAKLEKNLKIIGIDISQNDVLNAKKNVKKYSCIEITQMNASKMSFSNGSFDIVVNFLGLEIPYGRKTSTFEEVWAKFGYGIEKNGMGHYSKTVLMIARKGYP